MQLGLIKPDIKIDPSVEFLPKEKNVFSDENGDENFDVDDQQCTSANVYREIP